MSIITYYGILRQDKTSQKSKKIKHLRAFPALLPFLYCQTPALLAYSRKIGAKIALFGHTHVPYNQYHDGIYMLNPGSIAFPRDCSRPSYGLIDITPKGIITNTTNFNQFKK